MSGGTLRSVFTGMIAVISIGGGLAYALIAQQAGHSPEPPAWLALLIGGAVTYYYGQNAHLNGSTAALATFAAALTARDAPDVTAAANVAAHPSAAAATLASPPPPTASSG